METLMIVVMGFIFVVGCGLWWLDVSETGQKWLDKAAEWFWN